MRGGKQQAKRQELTARIADILLREGLAEIPLRSLAEQLGTSDRMLLYYFDDKSDLVLSSLNEVSGRLAHVLNASAEPQRRPADELFAVVMAQFESGALAPFMTIWADITARGGRGEAPFDAFARGAAQGWLQWLEQRLDIDDSQPRREAAMSILAVAEGARLLEAALPGITGTAARRLLRAFRTSG